MSNQQPTLLAGNPNPGWTGQVDTQWHHGPKNKPYVIGSLVRIRSGIYTLSGRVGVVVSVDEDLVYPDEYEVFVTGQLTHWFDYDEIERVISGRGDQ
tara:strand:+ start:1894 stop:2184 length:291 start_codon:yes stop_codon:yes gene_type:complete